jgi:hypothetical protein
VGGAFEGQFAAAPALEQQPLVEQRLVEIHAGVGRPRRAWLPSRRRPARRRRHWRSNLTN